MSTFKPVVEAEQKVYSVTPGNNGAGPLWCFGNTCIVRDGESVFISGIKTLEDHIPINNVRWMLFKNTSGEWTMPADGGKTHEREPCPLAQLDGNRLFLSTNPNSCGPDEENGEAQPQVLVFDMNNPAAAPKVEVPPWSEKIKVRGHTYRSLVADRARGELVLFYNVGYEKTFWTFRDANGQWSSQGAAEYPWGAEYDKPQPVRICYPTVQMKDRAVYYCGVSDIKEPYNVWREYKGQDWDYDFRRLFFTWSDDITKSEFHPWVEIASRDKTCGWIFPCDLWVGPDKRVHILWTERAINERLREKFFPQERQSIALNYAVVQDGKVVLRKPILHWDEGQEDVAKPGRGRFHTTTDGKLLVLYYTGGSASGNVPRGMRLVEIAPDGRLSQPVIVPVQMPMEEFFTTTVRAGNEPSDVIDLLGYADGMRYYRIRLK